MKETLCWSCTNPGTGRCCWDQELKPVPGWVAEATETDGFDTFRVISCPMYEREVRKQMPHTANRKRLMGIVDRCDRMGLTLWQIADITGEPIGVIHAVREKVRKSRDVVPEGLCKLCASETE